MGQANVSDESQLQVRPKDGDSSLSLSKARSGLIARGLREVTVLAVPPAAQPTDDLSEIRRHAEAGDADAQFNLGLMYGEGRAGRQNYAEAARWFRRAADQGDAKAEPYARWYQRAADEDAEAGFNLGVMYVEGRGVQQSYAAAARLFREAADQGHFRAHFYLGGMYERGEGVERDLAEALRWYSSAADIAWSGLTQEAKRHPYLRSGPALPIENRFEDCAEVVVICRKAADLGHDVPSAALGIFTREV